MSSEPSNVSSLEQSHAARQYAWQKLMRLPQGFLRMVVFLSGAAITAVLLALFSASFQSLEERVGALGWTLFADAALEERIGHHQNTQLDLDQISPGARSR